jgi:hypothetical protein
MISPSALASGGPSFAFLAMGGSWVSLLFAFVVADLQVGSWVLPAFVRNAFRGGPLSGLLPHILSSRAQRGICFSLRTAGVSTPTLSAERSLP